jgi:hypothetical protein
VRISDLSPAREHRTSLSYLYPLMKDDIQLSDSNCFQILRSNHLLWSDKHYSSLLKFVRENGSKQSHGSFKRGVLQLQVKGKKVKFTRSAPILVHCGRGGIDPLFLNPRH